MNHCPPGALNNPIVDKILAIEGITEATLKSAIYFLRKRLNQCTKGSCRCDTFGKGLCQRHSHLQKIAETKRGLVT